MTSWCRELELPADVGLQGGGDSQAELFSALGEGLAQLVAEPSGVRVQHERPLAVTAGSLEELLVEFLWALLVVLQTDRFIVATVEVTQASERAVHAILRGEPFDPARHRYRTEVKAITYHKLAVTHDSTGWVAQVIIDL